MSPVYDEEPFVVHLDVIDPKTGHVLSKQENEDSIHRYSGLLELPLALAGKDLNKALNETLNEQIKAAVLNAWQQGAFSMTPRMVHVP